MPESLHSRSKFRRWWRIWAIGGVDHDAVLKQVVEESGWSARYAFMTLISAGLSLLGLLIPSAAVLIGAMLLSPLMMPIIGLGFGIATFDFREIKRAALALALGSALAVLLCVIMVSISPLQTITSEIAGRTRPTLFDLLVALLSAVAGAYALIRARGSTAVGVAIAIALMPPLAVVGFGIATWNWTVFSGALLLFLTNAVTIALTAALVARAYGFGSHLSPAHTGGQVLLFIGALGVLAVPLSGALKQIAFEALAQRQVRDTVRARFPQEARLGQIDIDYTPTPIRVRAVMMTPRIEPNADRILAADLRARLARPVDIHVDQLRTSMTAGATEAAQIARASDTPAISADAARDRAAADLALIAGIPASEVTADQGRRRLVASAAALPGLGMDGYRALETRASAAIGGWDIALAPPATASLPAVPFRQGVVDAEALDLAAWASARTGRVVSVAGGLKAQREAIVSGIEARGGRAVLGTSRGALALAWQAEQP